MHVWKQHVLPDLLISLGACVLYLKGLGQGTGSFILQAIPASDEHSQFKLSSVGKWLFVAVDQSFSQDLHKPSTTVTNCMMENVCSDLF